MKTEMIIKIDNVEYKVGDMILAMNENKIVKGRLTIIDGYIGIQYLDIAMYDLLEDLEVKRVYHIDEDASLIDIISELL